MILCSIRQIKNVEDCEYAFCRFTCAVKSGFSLKDYETVYDTVFDEYPVLESTGRPDYEALLDHIYEILNVDALRPKDYEGRSLSVSDIVQLGDSYYYCNNIGWVEIPNELIYKN